MVTVKTTVKTTYHEKDGWKYKLKEVMGQIKEFHLNGVEFIKKHDQNKELNQEKKELIKKSE